MKSPIQSCAISLALSLGALSVVYAGSATWSSNPTSGDWNTAENWTPATVPNGPSDIATFNTSSITGISLSDAIEVAGIVFNAGANPFTITCAKQLTLSGSGITNNSGVTQRFISQSAPIKFTHSATAGSGTAFTNAAGYIEFDGRSSAGSARFTTQKGVTIFFDNATCDSATFLNEDGGTTYVHDGANATFINNAGNPGGETYFGIGSKGGNAILIGNGGAVDGGEINFDTGSRGGTARVEIFDTGNLYLPNTGGITLGSIEGDGIIELGDWNLKTGNNNLSTIFGGLIKDEVTEGNGGTLTKQGSGTLTLTSANSYRNGTVVSSGRLVVANTTGSATGSGTVQVNGGTLGGKGIIAGPTTIGTGAFLAPAAGTNKRLTLSVQSSLTFNSNATYTYTYKAKKNIASTDLVVANGVTINSGAILDFDGAINGRLTPGLVFTVISNTSATPISGIFSNLPDGSTVVLAGNTFQANYEGGDGNDLTLTVMP